MTKEDLIALGYKIINFTGHEEDHIKLLKLFDDNVPYPNGSTLFYYPQNFNGRKDNIKEYHPSVEQVVDIALNYKPQQLPPPAGPEEGS